MSSAQPSPSSSQGPASPRRSSEPPALAGQQELVADPSPSREQCHTWTRAPSRLLISASSSCSILRVSSARQASSTPSLAGRQGGCSRGLEGREKILPGRPGERCINKTGHCMCISKNCRGRRIQAECFSSCV